MSVSLPRPLKIGRWMRWCLYAGTYINTHISFHRSLSTQLSPLLSKNRQSLATWLFVPPKIARQRSHVFLSPVSSQMTERLVTYLFELKTSKSLMHVFLEDVETSYLDHQLPTKPPSPSHPLFSTHLSSLWFENWYTRNTMTPSRSCSSKMPENPPMICWDQNPYWSKGCVFERRGNGCYEVILLSKTGMETAHEFAGFERSTQHDICESKNWLSGVAWALRSWPKKAKFSGNDR
jgi:hypothetical protein